ncbi:uncharacterized protein LOC117341882 [Pecten maximus]|uniref:uncharacterized protein LOC117341882 n=1 Tax=Pecten maximus TaxID=6579 RepID=UPI0014585916|nr:uncharacterized protein LOC117341882 [Pecten maximus]
MVPITRTMVNHGLWAMVDHGKTMVNHGYLQIISPGSQIMNVHLLRHLASTVKQFGPLYGFSCYGFESMNSYLKSMVHGTGHVNSQVCFAVGMSKQISNLIQQYIHGNIDDTIKSLAESLGSKLIKEDRTVKGRVTALGQRRPLNPASSYYNAVYADIRASNPSVFLRL